MDLDKYQKWLDAEKQAQAAEAAIRVPRRNWKGWHPRTPAGEENARRLRLEADSLFDEAMDQMNKEVEFALSKPMRQPSSW